MAEEPVGCAKPTGAVIGQTQELSETPENKTGEGGKQMVTARVGAKAPDFQAPAFQSGKFINVKLSDYAGKWVLLCFYPGDFTFV